MSLSFLIFLLKISSEGVRSQNKIFHKPIQYWDCTFSNNSCIVYSQVKNATRYNPTALHCVAISRLGQELFNSKLKCQMLKSFKDVTTFCMKSEVTSYFTSCLGEIRAIAMNKRLIRSRNTC